MEHSIEKKKRSESRFLVWDEHRSFQIAKYHHKSSFHRPQTKLHLFHCEDGIWGRFYVRDQFVIARETKNQSMVCMDSCVELFIQPLPGVGYFNLEINLIGTICCFYIEDPQRVGPYFKRYTQLSCEDLSHIDITPSYSLPIISEIEEPFDWTVSFFFPYSLMMKYQPQYTAGSSIKANAFKCAGHSSMPHWGSLFDIGEQLNFHQPEKFETFHFLS